MSSQELWTKRDQVTGEQLPIEDRELILHQYQTRNKNHSKSQKSKAHGRLPRPTANVGVASLVFVYTDRDKLQARKRYLVVSVEGNKVKLRRFTNQLIGSKEYDSNLQEIYKVPSLEDRYLPVEDNSSSEEEYPTLRSKPNTEESVAQHTSELSDDVYEDDDDLNNSEEDDSDELSDQPEEPDEQKDDPTFTTPKNVTPAKMTRERRQTKNPNWFGEWVPH